MLVAGLAGYTAGRGSTVSVAIGIAAVVVLAAVGAPLMTRFLLLRPLRRVEDALARVADGELTARAGVHGKMGVFTDLVETFDRHVVANLQVTLLGMRNLVQDNEESARRLSELAESSQQSSASIHQEVQAVRQRVVELDGRIEHAASSARQLGASAHSIQSRMAEQSSAVEQTSAAIEQMNASLASMAQIAAEKASATEQLVSITTEGGKAVADANQIVQELSAGVSEMLDIVGVIQNVAAQTNLLAMNAAIEAAHAGEYGRGFAVVADEIRKLAESTAKNTKHVGRSLTTFVEGIKRARGAGDSAAQSFGRVQGEVTSFVSAFSEISAGTHEAAQGSDEMLEAVESLRKLTTHIGTEATEMNVGAAQIEAAIGSVREFSAETRNQMETVAQAVETVIESQNAIAGIGKQAGKHATLLATELRSFVLESGGERAYNPVLRRVILDHKQRTMSAAMALRGGIETALLPPPSSADQCPLGVLIAEHRRTNNAPNEALEEMDREHHAFHKTYNDFVTAMNSGAPERARELYATLDAQWKGLVRYRELTNALAETTVTQ